MCHLRCILCLLLSPPQRLTLFPYTTLFRSGERRGPGPRLPPVARPHHGVRASRGAGRHERRDGRSEEHTSELQSRVDVVCRLLLEKKKYSQNSKIKEIVRTLIILIFTVFYR